MQYKLMKVASYLSSLILFFVYFVVNTIVEFLNRCDGLYTAMDFILFLFSLVLMVLAIGSIMYVFYYFKKSRLDADCNRYIKIARFYRQRNVSSNYILSNLLPIIAVDLSNSIATVFIVLALLLIGIIYFHNDIYYANPILDLLKVKVYEADIFVSDCASELQKLNCESLADATSAGVEVLSNQIVMVKDGYLFKNGVYRILGDTKNTYIARKM